MKAKRSDITAKKSIQIQAGVNTSQSVTQTSSQGTIWNKQRMTQESRTTHVNPRIDGDMYFYTPKARVQQRAGSGPIANITSDVPIDYVDMIDQHHYTSKSQKSLSAGAAMIVRLAVTLPMLMNPVTFGLTGTTGTMAGAGFSTLCSDAAVSLIENDGNAGRALQAMGRNGTVLNVVKSMATAGITKELGDALGIKTAPTFDESGKLVERTFTDYAKTAVLQSAVSTAMTIGIDGVDPGEALKQGAVSAVVNTAAAWGAGKIGSMYRVKAVDPLVHKVLHAGLGATSGAITSSILGGDVRMAALSGATGAFLAETLADVLKPDEKAEVKSAIQNKMNRKEFEDAFMAKAQASTHWANFVATVAAFGIGQDAGIAYGAAHNATANNNIVCLAIAALALAEEYAIYETLYALAAAGATISLKLLLDRININQNKDGSYGFNGQRYETLSETLEAAKSQPLLLEQVMAIEFIRNFMDANPDAGKPTSLTTPIHEPKPITLVTPIADLDREALVEGFDRAPEGFDTGLTEGFEAYDGPRITSFTKILEGVPYPENPREAKESFKPVGTKAKESKIDGSVWEKDTSRHGGEQWKVWKTKRSWERGEQPASVWPDGRIRKWGDQNK